MSDLEKQPSQETATTIDDFLKYPAQPWYLKVPFVSQKPSSLRKNKDGDNEKELIPEASAGIFSLITFAWMFPILSTGYTRPLETTDLYQLQAHRSSAHIGELIVESFERRRKIANEYNDRLASGDVKPGWRWLIWTVRGDRVERERQWRASWGRKSPSLVLALNDSVRWWFWSAGVLRVMSDSLTITSPLLVQAIINFVTDSYTARSQGTSPPPLWKGALMGLGLFLMQLTASLCQHHYWYRASSTGVLVRGGLIAALYSRSFSLSPRARVTLPNGQLVTHIASDVSRIDMGANLAHATWSTSVQIVIALVILLVNLGPSALAGFSLFLLGMPVQSWILKMSYIARTNSMKFTDTRVKLIQELLSGIRVIKFFAWEIPFLKRLVEIRKNEMKYVRKLLLIRSGNTAVATSFPILATVITFICYSLTGHTLEPGIIFTSLTLFQLLRGPVMLMPVALGSVTDGYNAICRIYGVFIAETVEDDRIVDSEAEDALVIDHASFTWEIAPPSDTSSKKKKSRKSKKTKSKKSKGKGDMALFDEKHHDAVAEHEQAIFQIHDVNLRIPRGQLCAIVGPVGSGKSSLLQGVVGEMRKTQGSITLGGSVSYCPQSAWIQNATIRENICFGKPFDSERYWKAVHDSCLEADFALMEYGDMTEIGEKGISLSGGQKQRINICRSIYANTDIQIFDDPLSALDAYVGKEVFQNVLKSKSRPDTTKILVTHALHFLPQVDFIITIDDGKIVEQGTYEQLTKNEKGVFAKLMKEFDRSNKTGHESDDESEEEESGAIAESTAVKKESKTPGTALMQNEERAVGTVSGSVYASYFSAGKGKIFVPIVLASLFFMQAANVLSSYWLVYWEERKWPQTQAFYIGIYSALGLSQAIFSFLLGSMFAIQAYFASRELHRKSFDRILHAPTSFFETTPLGRIVNRFSKDTDTVDNFLADAWNSFMNSVASIGGAIVLISAVFPWFLIPAFVLAACYFYFSIFYRAGTRELNRLNSVLRGTLVSHFSESLSGMSTIRAYGQLARFQVENEKRVDNENEAYWLTVASQRWLSIRLDSFGAILIFIVAMLTVIGRYLISPSQSGIMLSYILSIQSSLSLVVKQGAQVEIYMNSVERMVHYAEEVEQENFKGDEQPPECWPRNGSLEFKDLYLSYRLELPPVLKGLNMRLASGEKLGIVGRTGAGKSSIMVALFRMVEAKSGSIVIDGVNTAKIDLEALRSAMSIIPQEAVLFPGTIRSNLDPFGQHDDSVLWDALKRAHLTDPKSREVQLPTSDEEGDIVSRMKANRFSLDAPVDDEGGNVSMGERSLISLARALVKKSRILVLDEATASVDFETDKKIQDTIAHEFRDQTILCIAHRINTIIGYDRVCVMDAGKVSELDTPTKLFEQNGIFRSMCDQSGISLEDILLAQKARSMA